MSNIYCPLVSTRELLNVSVCLFTVLLLFTSAFDDTAESWVNKNSEIADCKMKTVSWKVPKWSVELNGIIVCRFITVSHPFTLHVVNGSIINVKILSGADLNCIYKYICNFNHHFHFGLKQYTTQYTTFALRQHQSGNRSMSQQQHFCARLFTLVRLCA